MTRKEVAAALRAARESIPPASNGSPSAVVGKAPLGEKYVACAYWMFHRGNPGAWKVWYEVRTLAGTVVASNTIAASLARVLAEAEVTS
jgi:hypothetical protein